MNTRPALRLALAAALTAGTALPAAALEPFNAEYQASYMGMQANGSMTLAREGQDRWKYSLQIRNQVADLRQMTVFEEHQGQLRPLSSNDQSVMLIRRRSVNANYDWKTAQATWSGDVKADRRGPVKLQAGDMDALLMNLAVTRDAQAGKAMAYRLVDQGRARPMQYEIAGKEQITVAGEQKQATKVVRRDEKKETIAWVVADMPVPARILQRENGQDTIDLTLKALN